jgi:predicted permease
MLSTLAIVTPIFALVFAGWLVRRLGVLGPNATSELNRFVVFLALPALLFDIVAHARWADLWQPGFIAAFGGSSFLIVVLTVVLRLRRPRHLADAVLDGLNAGYANTGFIGFPLVLVALGPGALAVTTVATILTVCVLFAVAIVAIEIGLQTQARRRDLFAKVALSLLRNPLLVAPAFLKLLGGAASPSALVALGLFLAARRDTPGDARATALLVGLKLIGQPLVAWASPACCTSRPS